MKNVLRAQAMFLILAAASAVQGQDRADVQDESRAAAHVTLAPLRLELDEGVTATTLRVVNPSTRDIGVQLRAFDWSQPAGEDVYTPATDVRISPSIITIAPGKTQVFRVLRRAQFGGVERRYRIVVDQLPDPALEADGVTQTRLRFTIPMFADRASAPPARLGWAIQGGRLRVSNTGGQTARITGLGVTDQSGKGLRVEGMSLTYVMGGASREWALAEGCPVAPVRVTAQIDGESFDEQVTPRCG